MALTTRRRVLQISAGTAGAMAFGLHPEAYAEERTKDKGGKLVPPAFTTLPLGEVRPLGWLERQLRLQADGLGGHLDEFWQDVGVNSGWLGGKGESWERGPYFADGLYPLAVLLSDQTLLAKAMKFINWTLDHQAMNGMIGPASNDDWWPRMVMLKVLAQFHDATKDGRVIPVLTRYFHYQLAALPERPLQDWGRYRWQDEAMVVEWLYDRTRDEKLLELLALLKKQGFDWVGSFAAFRYTGVTTRELQRDAASGANSPAGMATHGVNNGQALKTAAVEYRITGSAGAKEDYDRQMAALDKFHGLPNGMFSCDEHLAGRDPSHGTELCTVVETMFSLGVSLAVFGDAVIGDRLEKIAYNALPGTFTDDMWAHQYDQQPNQIQVGLNSKPWTTNGPEANLFGLEPNFGCCTANFHQGWPKLTAGLWMRAEDGLVAAVYAPCEVRTTVAGTAVHVKEETEYPFRDTVRITVAPAQEKVFTMRFRVPGWAEGATVSVNGKAATDAAVPGTFHAIKRTWRAGDVVELKFPMKPVVSRWFHGSMALMRGPLVFSLSPGETWVKLRDRGLTADWQVFPREGWNYALRVDEKTAAKIDVVETPVGARPFSADDSGVRLRVAGRRLDTWKSEDGVAAPVPEGIQSSTVSEEILTLIPYGAAKLRVTAFPQLA